jgi:hypothetical protein
MTDDGGNGSRDRLPGQPGRPSVPWLPVRPDPGLLAAVPGLVRVAAALSWRAVRWTADTSAQATSQVLRAAIGSEPPGTASADLRSFAWRALGLAEQTDRAGVPERIAAKGSSTEELRARGAALLHRSADVRFEEDMHPAYERILDEIAPDEARLLRFLAANGPQPTVDVRTNRPLGRGSELVAAGLSMVGEQAGCRHLDRTNAYLNNLFRLGLMWFSKEQVDPNRYQLVEVQPVVTAALRRAGRAPRTVRRSIHLTPFGEDFCRICLPLEDGFGRHGQAEPPRHDAPGPAAPDR